MPIDKPMATDRTRLSSSTRRRITVTLAATVLAVGVVIGTIAQYGDASGLIGVGPDSPAFPVVHQDLPHAVEFTGTGLDGALFYVIARSPFDVHRAAEHLDYPTYRLRRILFPAAGGIIAPGGGTALILTLAALSVLGVGLGAWWLTRFPSAPPWLGLTAVINPGIILALSLTLCDALATGLVLAAFGSMFHKRRNLAIAFLVLACLTRETSVIAVFALATWPGLSKSRRAATVLIPTVPLAAWSLYVPLTLGESIFAQNAGGTFTWPLWGWIQSGAGATDLMIGLLAVVLIGAALARRKSVPLPVTFYLAVTLVMVVCAAPIVAETWFGTGRVICVAFPLAIWVLTRRAPRKSRISRPGQPVGASPASVTGA